MILIVVGVAISHIIRFPRSMRIGTKSGWAAFVLLVPFLLHVAIATAGALVLVAGYMSQEYRRPTGILRF